LILEILWSQRTKSATSNYKAQDDWRSFKGSLSETLVNAGVQAGLASKMTKVYSWSIDFFKLKRRPLWSCFTERYINDSIYDGVEDLEASFSNTKEK
jgi:hypothetical protein